MGKINVWLIVKDHLSTLRDYDTEAPSARDWLLFLGLPFLFSASGAWLRFDYGSDVLNALLAAFAIFAGLLLNLLVLICGFAGNPRFAGFDVASASRRRYLREVHQNISFSILVSIAVVVFALLGMSEIKYSAKPGRTVDSHPVLSFFLTYFLANFVLTLLMVLKRIHLLLADEFSGPRSAKKVA